MKTSLRFLASLALAACSACAFAQAGPAAPTVTPAAVVSAADNLPAEAITTRDTVTDMCKSFKDARASVEGPKVSVADRNTVLAKVREAERRFGHSCGGSSIGGSSTGASHHSAGASNAETAKLRNELVQASHDLAYARKVLAERQTSTEFAGGCDTKSRHISLGSDGTVKAALCKGLADEVYHAPPPPQPQPLIVYPAIQHVLGGASSGAGASASAAAANASATATAGANTSPAVGHVCRAEVDGKVVADFMSRDANPYKEQVASQGEGPKCRALQERFKRDNPQYRW